MKGRYAWNGSRMVIVALKNSEAVQEDFVWKIILITRFEEKSSRKFKEGMTFCFKDWNDFEIRIHTKMQPTSRSRPMTGRKTSWSGKRSWRSCKFEGINGWDYWCRIMGVNCNALPERNWKNVGSPLRKS